ncbi:MAG: DEAD/DEAH box helicase [Planctomycetota bacterium]
MALNPVRFAQEVIEGFLNYQLTAFPITDADLAKQAREMLKRPLGNSPLIKGPYISLSKSFKMGADLRKLAATGQVHPALPGLTDYPVLFAHQDKTLQAIQFGNHCLVATGTGSGKTESFLYPILDHCLRLRDANEPDGLVAVLVYPMNALAQDQLLRLRHMLAGSGITFGMYIGSTPSDPGELGEFKQLERGQGRTDYEAALHEHAKHTRMTIAPWEECLTEKEMATRRPRLLLTNVNQLELLLTRGKDLGMFIGAPLKFLVFDEAHTYSGAVGAEVACLIRRLRAFCGKGPEEVICVGTSATVTDPKEGPAEGAKFASRFFGVDQSKVRLVVEEYQEQEFPKTRYTPPAPFGDAVALLDRILAALEGDGDAAALQIAVKDLAGATVNLTPANWRAELYEHLKASEYIHQVYHFLSQPSYLPEAVQRIGVNLKRKGLASGLNPQAELLAYLALGAAAEKDGNVLLRPKVHYFIRGLEGAVLTFGREPRETPSRALRWSVEAALEEFGERSPHAVFPVAVCKTCGQHYLLGFYRGLEMDRGDPTGGQGEDDGNVYWEPVGEEEGTRVNLTDRFITEGDEDEGQTAGDRLDRKRFPIYVCRTCGTLHKNAGDKCSHPRCKREGKLVRLWGLRQTGPVALCPSCGQKGAQIGDRPIEPIRPLRAVNVANVHILAQNMVNAAPEGERKLIIFSDNRQDAAFQAGWMQDHARRYRIRHLIYDYLKTQARPCSLGDIQDDLVSTLNADQKLARAIAPEVYSGRGEEAFGRGLQENLRYYLRILLVREVATGFKQRDGLEPWGMARVIYHGLTAEHQTIQRWARQYHVPAAELAEGVAALLDSFRRSRYLHDSAAPIFTQYWHESAEEIQRGYMPFMDQPPKGLKLTRESSDKDTYVVQFISARGQTLAQNFVSKWGIPRELVNGFLEELLKFLTNEVSLFEPVTLLGQRKNALPGVSGVFQVASGQLGILTQKERYRCTTCQRVHARPTPRSACSAMHCQGKVTREEPSADDYNIALLEQAFSMVMAEEHSAQVPAQTRTQIEADFKRPNGRTNCLVATPTLEMGVDIGDLDMVLMRNVPPKPSNYWQRVGRAGRRHRMAVLFTYCRASSHDRTFFDQPEALLDGLIETPRFNLNNPVMVQKHVHAAVMSELIRLSRMAPEQSGLSEADVKELREIQKQALPDFIGTYLFEEGRHYRNQPYDVSGLRTLLTKHETRLRAAVAGVFATYWPEEAQQAATHERLADMIQRMTDEMQAAVNGLHQRMMWAVQTLRKLTEAEHKKLLDDYEMSLRRRCERYLRSLGIQDRSTYALSVLATEGFFPGYGIYDGGVRAFASRALGQSERAPDFDLGRPASIAVREFVPGNLLYANNGRYKVTLYHLPVGESKVDPEEYLVSLEKQMVMEAAAAGRQPASYNQGALLPLSGLPICDADIAQFSRITDEENNRFQLPVAIMGYLRQEHRGGKAYKLSEIEIQHRFGQRLRLVNLGPADRVKKGELGYPMCSVCGATRSPYASASDLGHFLKLHKERCGKEPGWLGLHAETTVDGLLFAGMPSQEETVNLGEAVRMGAARVLEMGLDDLQYLNLPRQDGKHDLWLYDPMPGGSGLLTQILERWEDVCAAATKVLQDCPKLCESSCYSCMRTYRNSYSHSLLNRHKAVEVIEGLTGTPTLERDMPAVEGVRSASSGEPTNTGEARLGEMLQRAGFPPFSQQQRLDIGKPYNSTTPDVYFDDPSQDLRVAVYLDGLCKAVHGNADRHAVDRVIRNQLESRGVNVIEIASTDLTDPAAMGLHFKRLAHALRRKDLAIRIS